MNSCGDCQVCCEVLVIEGISEGLTKCKNQCDVGCSIHSNKPKQCSDFHCSYIPNTTWGEELRPDKCGVLFVENKNKIVSYRLRDSISQDVMDMIFKMGRSSSKPIIGIDARIIYDIKKL